MGVPLAVPLVENSLQKWTSPSLRSPVPMSKPLAKRAVPPAMSVPESNKLPQSSKKHCRQSVCSVCIVFVTRMASGLEFAFLDNHYSKQHHSSSIFDSRKWSYTAIRICVSPTIIRKRSRVNAYGLGFQ